MSLPREPLKHRWSTAALLAGGLAGAALGVVGGFRFAMATCAERTFPAPSAASTRFAPPSQSPTDARRLHAVADSDMKWRGFLARPPALARDEEMARWLESLAEESPARAVA